MFHRLFLTNRRITRDEFYKSRILFILESCAGGTIFNLTTGAFIAGLAVFLGASDRLTGFIAVIPMMAGMAQIFSPLILERLKERKTAIVSFTAFYKLLIGSVVFIPLLTGSPYLRLFLMVTCLVIAYSSLNIVFPGFSMWLTGVVPERSRGKYFGIKDSYSLAVITVVSLTMGYILDSYKKPGAESPEYTGFLIVFATALVLASLNIIILIKIRKPDAETSTSSVKLIDCFIKPFSNKAYMKVVAFFILWNIGLNLGAAFIPLYQVKYLHLDYKYIMFLNLISNIVMVVAVRLWGRYADRHTWVHSAVSSIGLLAVTHFLWGIVTPETLFLLPLVFVLNGISWGGINISLFNLPFLFVPQENKTIYLGFNAALGGVSGLISTLAGGQIVSALEGKVLPVGGVDIGNIQTVVFISAAFLALCALFGGAKLFKMLNFKNTAYDSKYSSIVKPS